MRTQTLLNRPVGVIQRQLSEEDARQLREQADGNFDNERLESVIATSSSLEEARQALGISKKRTRDSGQLIDVPLKQQKRPKSEDLEPTQISALASAISLLVQERFEDALAKALLDSRTGEVEAVAHELDKQPRDLDAPWNVSRRDQSHAFKYPIGRGGGTTSDITKINKLFGGSLKDTKTTKVPGAVATETTLDSRGVVKPESQYAEYHRAQGNRIGGGLDPRVRDLLDKSLNQDQDRLLAFAYLHKAESLSWFEVLQSGSSDPLTRTGGQIFANLPKPDSWQITPADLDDSVLIPYIIDVLNGEEPGSLGIPKELVIEIEQLIDSLGTTTEVGHADVEEVPRVLWHEVGASAREDIDDVSKKPQYTKLKGQFKQAGDVPAYVSLILDRGERFGDTAIDWYRDLALALTPPSARKRQLVPPTLGKGQKTPKARLKRNAKAIATKLGKYDYGVDANEKLVATEELIEEDPYAAEAINKYISGGFGTASDTLDAPWTQEGKTAPLKSLLAAVRGLERLPTHKGWTYRREETVANHTVGEIIAPGVLWSSALAPKFAEQFDKRGGGTLYAIQSLHTGRDVQLLAGPTKWYQREVLFPPYARFVVKGKETGPQGVIYNLEELPPEPSQDPGSSPPGYDVPELQGLQTLIDKRHWDTAKDKLARQEPWTQQDASKLGIEGLGPGLHDPRELYGEQTAERWQTLLRWRPADEHNDLWTVDGFIAIAGELSGEQQQLRDEPSGWGSGDDAYFELDPTQAGSLVTHGLRVGTWYDPSAFDPSKLKNLPDANDYRDDDYGAVDRGRWVVGKRKQLSSDGIWLWRQDAQRLLDVGALKNDGSTEYAIKYDALSADDIRRALADTLTTADKLLTGLVEQRTTSQLTDDQYAEAVTRVAADLQQRIVAIHPFKDANGRISRLYMYKVLQAYLPDDDTLARLPVIPETGKDLTTSTHDWGTQLWGLVRP